jgi:hypothetical protein
MNLHLFHDPPEVFRVTLGPERERVLARPVWAAPLSHPGRYLSLVDEKGEELAMVKDPETLDEASQAALERELYRRYLTATVDRFLIVEPKHGATYFSVSTDRGERDFVMQHLHDNALWFSPTHVLLIDVDGNRFEIPDTQKLDHRSMTLLRSVI